MKHGDGGKGDAQRPGKGYQDGYDLIWPSKRKAPEAPAEETKEEENDRRTA